MKLFGLFQDVLKLFKRMKLFVMFHLITDEIDY